jgi:hypothetical protein
MLRWLKNLLFESTPAEFRSDYSIAESVQRLSAVTSRWGLSLSQTQAVGKVSPDRVRLQRVIPMVRNSFNPFFTGHFETRDGRTVLTGHFAMSVYTRIFMTLWLAMATAFTVELFAGDVRSTNGTTAWPPLVTLLFPVGGIGFVLLAKWFARNDVPWLSAVITRALTTPGDVTPEKLTADASVTPEVLKGVALVLAAAGIISGVAMINTPQPLRPSWHTMYAGFAILDLVLAIGVWYRRPWAWWGGFLVLAAMMIAPVVTLPSAARQLPLVFQAAVAVCLLLVVGSWGGWWYGKRNLFLWSTAADSQYDGKT